jgi:glutamate-1-semialdehyde 2,1-aminomutase
LSVIAGRREIMEQIVIGGGVAFGGTFNGNPLSLAGAEATLTELSRDDGAALDHARAMGERLMGALRGLARKYSIPLTLTGVGTAFFPHFSEREVYTHYRNLFDDDAARLKRFLGLALEEGIQIVPDGRFYVSAAHTEEDIDETAVALERVFSRL